VRKADNMIIDSGIQVILRLLSWKILGDCSVGIIDGCVYSTDMASGGIPSFISIITCVRALLGVYLRSCNVGITDKRFVQTLKTW
jgi:hypothetical protein